MTTVTVHRLDANGICREEQSYPADGRAALEALYLRIERAFPLDRHMVTVGGVHMFGKIGHHEEVSTA